MVIMYQYGLQLLGLIIISKILLEKIWHDLVACSNAEKKTFDKLISYNDWVLGHFFPELYE